MHRNLRTIQGQELYRWALGRLGKPEVQVLLLPGLKEHHIATALQQQYLLKERCLEQL